MWIPLAQAVCFGAAILLYLPAMFDLPFSDDWEMFAWVEKHGSGIFYVEHNLRLWQRMLFALSYPSLGDKVLPLVIGLSIVVFLVTAALVSRVSRQLAPELPLAPLIVAVLYLFHPANASAVIQIDTFSQILADCLALLAIQQIVFVAAPLDIRSGIAAMLFTVCVLCAKETALGVLAWIPVAMYLRVRYVNDGVASVALGSAARVAVSVGLGVALYIWIRAQAGTPLVLAQSGRYAIHIEPATIALNATQLWGAAMYYGDAATLFVFGISPKVAASVVLSLLLMAAASMGLFQCFSRSPKTKGKIEGDAFIWFTFAAPAVAPAVFLGSVSELYSAGVVPFTVLGLGLGLASLLDRRTTSPGVALALLLAVAGWGAVSIGDKLFMHRQVSERNWAFVRAVRPLISACTTPKKMVVRGNLADTTSGGRPYSVFSHSNERILRNVIQGLTNPHVEAWLSRTAWVAVPADHRAARCDITAPCALSCEAEPTPASKILSCQVLRERCIDTRSAPVNSDDR
ncbi:MAG: hypothetical protein AABY95_04005 [Pseudomonadota bacterium]